MKTETKTIFYRKLPLTRITKKAIQPIFPYEIPYTEIPKKDNAVDAKPQILFITSYPPRECGIANYSIDLIDAIEAKYANSFDIKICALETNEDHHQYPPKVNHSLNTENGLHFYRLAVEINANPNIEMVLIQHEFGFFHQKENHFENMIKMINKDIIIVFHTVLPNPDNLFKAKVQRIVLAANSVVVMTNNSSEILSRDYQIDPQKITVIPHGTHLVPHLDRISLKEKYNFKGRPIMATFGLLSSGKSIETSLKALPKIIAENKNTLFLIIGKTHPTILQREGETYRNKLESLVIELNLEKNVQFINQYLSSELLLEYLQMTDIYLFTSKDPNQAVSGTFAYAISCGCAVISTPIPHALEVIGNDAGLIIDFENNQQLSKAVIQLLRNENKLETIRQN